MELTKTAAGVEVLGLVKRKPEIRYSDDKKQVWFGDFGPVPTLPAAFAKGFETGKNWKWDHIPGGPSVYHQSMSSNDVNLVAYCQHTADVNEAWLAGWKTGIEAKKKEK